MRRDTFNFLVDVAALLAMLGLIATGLVMRFSLPPGSRGGQGLSLWGLTRHEWGDIHFWIAVALAALLVLHVALHWTWVCVLVRRWLPLARAEGAVPAARRRTAYGVAFLVLVAALVGAFLWLAAANVVRAGREDEGAGRGHRRGRALVPDGGSATMLGGTGVWSGWTEDRMRCPLTARASDATS